MEVTVQKNITTDGLYEIYEGKPQQLKKNWKVEYKVVFQKSGEEIGAGFIEGTSSLNATTLLQLEVSHLTKNHKSTLH